MNAASPRQIQILQFIRDYWAEHNHGPSIRDVGTGVGLASTSAVTYQLERMRSAGLIEQDPLLARTIRLARGESESSDGCSRIEGSEAEVDA